MPSGRGTVIALVCTLAIFTVLSKRQRSEEEALAVVNTARTEPTAATARLSPIDGSAWRPGVRTTARFALRTPLRIPLRRSFADRPLADLAVEVSLPAEWSAAAAAAAAQTGHGKFPILVFLHGRGESGDFTSMNSQSLPRLLGGDERTDSLHRGPNATFIAGWPFVTIMPQVGCRRVVRRATMHATAADGRQMRRREVGSVSFLLNPPRPSTRPFSPSGAASPPPRQCPFYCAQQNGWNKPEFEAVLDLVRAAQTELGGDGRRVYLAGQSMGGAGAWGLAAYSPATFAAMSAMCSYCPQPYYDCPAAVAAKLRPQLPVWIFHGANDVVIPVRAADEMVAALKAAGNSKLRYTRYEWAPPPPDPRYSRLSGHAVHDVAFVEPELASWFLQYRTPRAASAAV
jgi:dienelactone hydrolase